MATSRLCRAAESSGPKWIAGWFQLVICMLLGCGGTARSSTAYTRLPSLLRAPSVEFSNRMGLLPLRYEGSHLFTSDRLVGSVPPTRELRLPCAIDSQAVSRVLRSM